MASFSTEQPQAAPMLSSQQQNPMLSSQQRRRSTQNPMLSSQQRKAEDEQNVATSEGGGAQEAVERRTVAAMLANFVQVQDVLDKTSARWAIVLLIEARRASPWSSLSSRCSTP